MALETHEVPFHLQQFIAQQECEQYTAIDHASWRYIMRLSQAFFKERAHPKYLDGLQETGISTERIPRISEMDEKLRKFGWRAVVVTGFIPPEAFLEMLSLQILPIACDMRKLEHIDYTPAPDIVHEAAGHAPIIADEAYASYLRKFGEIARRVMFAKEDNDVYEAILDLSETKEDPHSSAEDIARAQRRLDEAYAKVSYVSEAQQLTRLGWWTIEYGLFQKDGRYLIYGAGLLSSVGESFNCLGDNVRKVELTVNCVEQEYDITKPQPQLFYTDDFKKLEAVIDELASRMAYKRGGIEALEIAKRSQTVTTTELETGLQIGGILSEFRVSDAGQVAFVRYVGPTQLAYQEKQLEGHGPTYHVHGFSTPLGRIRGIGRPTSELNWSDFEKLGFQKGQKSRLEFESGIAVEGVLIGILEKDNRALILSFSDCTVRWNDEVLFMPEWGTFDMACGERVVSAFGGAADRGAYIEDAKVRCGKARPQKSNLTEQNKPLVPLYARVREIREAGHWNSESVVELENIVQQADEKFPGEWLLRMEILELLNTHQAQPQLQARLRENLKHIATKAENVQQLIERGLALLS